MMERAKSIYVCVFTMTPTNQAYEYDAQGQPTAIAVENLTADEQRVWNYANDAANQLYIKYKFQVQVALCPLDYGNNAPIAFGQGIEDFPGMLITGEYAGGKKRQYILKKDLKDKFLGVDWTGDDIYPYYKALYLQQFGTGEACNLPFGLCNVSALVWLIAAGLATYKAVEQKKTLRVVWGAGAAFAGHQFIQAGGFAAVKKLKLKV